MYCMDMFLFAFWRPKSDLQVALLDEKRLSDCALKQFPLQSTGLAWLSWTDAHDAPFGNNS